MAGLEGFSVPPAAVTGHAAVVDSVAGAVEQARAAAAQVQVGRGAYGQLCQWLPGLFDGVQDKIVGAYGLGRDALMATADRLQAAAGVYVAGDDAVASGFGRGR